MSILANSQRKELLFSAAGVGACVGDCEVVRSLPVWSAPFDTPMYSNIPLMISIVAAKNTFNGVTILLIANDSNYYLSIDAINWTTYTVPAIGTYVHVAGGNGWFVMFGTTGTFRSRDGVSWEIVTHVPAVATNYASISTPDKAVFLCTQGIASDGFFTSDGGTTWQSCVNTQAYGFAYYAGGKYFRMMDSSDLTHFKYSDDLTTWTTVTVSLSGNWTGAAYANGIYAVHGAGGYIFRSTDNCVTWDGPFDTITAGVRSGVLLSVGDYFYGFSNDTPTRSRDAVNWVTVPTVPSLALYACKHVSFEDCAVGFRFSSGAAAGGWAIPKPFVTRYITS